jgi:hypothetical protein
MTPSNSKDSGIRILKGKHLKPIEDYVKGLNAEEILDPLFRDGYDTLVDAMVPTYSHCMLASNVSTVLYLALLEFQMEQGYATENNKVTDAETVRQRLFNKLKTAFERYPCNYEVRIGLPSFRAPKEGMRIDIMPGMWLDIREGSGKSSDSALVLSGIGYLDGHLNSPLGFKILSQAKLFVFFMRSLNLVQIQGYSVLARGAFKNLEASEEEATILLPNGLSQCFGGLALHIGTLVRPRGEKILRLSVMFENLRDAIEPLKSLLTLAQKDESITTAIEWYEDSHFAENETVAFLEACIGFEALLQDPDRRLDDMTSRLCDRLAFSLGTSRGERKTIATEYRTILELRGQLVHSRQARIHDAQRKHLDSARSLLKRLIDSELKLVSVG